jgi:hypothetical protein
VLIWVRLLTVSWIWSRFMDCRLSRFDLWAPPASSFL